LPNKAEGDWECIRHPGGALVIPVTTEGKLVLVKQYRFAVQRRLYEFPAGTLEAGEDPLETVQREIQEETGYKSETWKKLGEFFLAPGYSDEVIYAFLATEATIVENPPEQDEDEDIETILMTVPEVEAAIYAGDIADSKSISSFMLARSLLVDA
jgi:ADP-ribose pyrophosphatase